ncbi:hypothetical protein HRbin18_01172 [bacterium HR18]|nr:hypothetical protein HRbin18_01172 [bacterium HR18]
MRYWSLLVAGGGAILIACQLTPNPNVTRWTLVELWQLHDSLARPESALFDAASGVIYVSNINGGPLEKDGNGFISRISPEGRLLEARWVSGLHAPKGMALSRGRLYVADIDTLVEIDVATGQITARYGAPGARFLNDVTVDTTGNVYVSDSQTHRIYRLQGDAMEVWLESPLLRSPNGLYALPTYLVVAAADNRAENPGAQRYLHAVFYAERTIRPLGATRPLGGLDAVEPANGGFFLSDWGAGRLFFYDVTIDSLQLLAEISQGTADFDYVPEQQRLYVPVMMSDRLIAYEVRPSKEE